METYPRLNIVGAALADPTRVRILCEMMDGRAFTNKELACAANVAAQTASVHLKHLEIVGLTKSLRGGRHVYHQIANADVAGVLEALAGLIPTHHVCGTGKRAAPEMEVLIARSCYNHVAGRLAVLLTERMIASNLLQIRGDAVSIGCKGHDFFHGIGIETTRTSGPGQPMVKFCLDWTERRHHISGFLGAALMQKSLSMKWLERRRGSRALTITPLGFDALEYLFGLKREAIEGMEQSQQFDG